MSRSRILAAAVALAAIVPVVAAGRAACCAVPIAPKPHACCVGKTMAPVAAPRGCCKTPVAPKPETTAKDAAPPALAVAPLVSGAPMLAVGTIAGPAAVRLARLDHRASSPDDSPPDLLARTQSLLI